MGALRQLWNIGNNIPIPNYLKNSVFYFDKNLSTVTDTSTMIVNDLSPCGNHPKQSTAGKKPSFSTSNGLTFDNTDDCLIFDNPIPICPQNFTWYVRYNRTSVGQTSMFLMPVDDIFYNSGNGTHPAQIWYYFGTNSIILYVGPTAVTFSGLASDDLSGDHLYKIISNITNCTLYIDGVQKGQVSIPAGWLTKQYGLIKSIGSQNNTFQDVNGKVSQIMLCNKALTTDEATIVETQLTNKETIPNYSKPRVSLKSLFGDSQGCGRIVYSDFSSDYQNLTRGQVLDIVTGTFKPVGLGDIDHGEGKAVNNGNYKCFELPYSYLRNEKTFWLKHAVGSTTLADKLNINNWSITEDVYSYALYYTTRIYIRYAINLVASLGYTVNYDELIWSLGGNDALLQADANAHEVNLTNWFNSFRTFIGNSNLPITIMRTSAYNDTSEIYRGTIQAAQDNVAAALQNVKIINTDSYAELPDGHWAKDGIISGGADLFNKNYM